MYFINPFKGLRPTKENASSVTIASTDHLTEDMKKDLLKKNPWNYLNKKLFKILKNIKKNSIKI